MGIAILCWSTGDDSVRNGGGSNNEGRGESILGFAIGSEGDKLLCGKSIGRKGESWGRESGGDLKDVDCFGVRWNEDDIGGGGVIGSIGDVIGDDSEIEWNDVGGVDKIIGEDDKWDDVEVVKIGVLMSPFSSFDFFTVLELEVVTERALFRFFPTFGLWGRISLVCRTFSACSSFPCF